MRLIKKTEIVEAMKRAEDFEAYRSRQEKGCIFYYSEVDQLPRVTVDSLPEEFMGAYQLMDEDTYNRLMCSVELVDFKDSYDCDDAKILVLILAKNERR